MRPFRVDPRAAVAHGHPQRHARCSFSDGGRYHAVDDAIARGQRMREEGADIIDIGGESTRPGAVPVSADEEIARVTPVVEALRGLGIPLSVDTRAPAVMRAVLAAGADMINDVRGFARGGGRRCLYRGSRAGVVRDAHAR